MPAITLNLNVSEDIIRKLLAALGPERPRQQTGYIPDPGAICSTWTSSVQSALQHYGDEGLAVRTLSNLTSLHTTAVQRSLYALMKNNSARRERDPDLPNRWLYFPLG